MTRPEILEAFRLQIPACRRAGSEFTARLFEACLDDLESGGPVAEFVAAFEGNPLLDALPQRVLGALQDLVLAGRAPELARHFPPLGGTPAWPETGRAFVALLERHADELRPRLGQQVQTNEVRRCAALLGGFLAVARRTRLPLRILEIGCSGGLNLFFDRYRYELGAHRWGDPAANVVIRSEWRGPPPDLDASLRIASRLGCDPFPLDLRDPDQRRRVESFFWADQLERFDLIRAASAALPGPAPIEPVGAVEFLERELEQPRDGVATVVFHSSMWWYLSREERRSVAACIEGAGARAGPAAPLAWLRKEPPNLDYSELRLRCWPRGEDRLLARSQHHGRWVEWLAGALSGPRPR